MDNPYLPMRGIIKDIKNETSDTKTFTIELPDLRDPFVFAPGQYNMLSVMGVGEMPLTIGALSHDGKHITHTVRVVGDATSKLFASDIGGTVGIRGPLGRGWPVDKVKGKDLIITAGGLGLSPLRSLIETIELNRDLVGKVNLTYGAKTPDDMVFTDQFERWRRIPDFEILLTVDHVLPGRSWEHGVGVVTSVFDQLTVDSMNTLVFACGPEIMMRFVANSLIIRGISEGSLYVSMERRMECGMGKCGHCMIGPKYVCADGPVFSYPELKQLPHNLIAGKGLAA
ncbi:MAG: FAD/NAD(P)-binding protein [Chloroflexi bacterium]|nr:FAD/NAD(P)-binding protein [Chloroflexota bacterium]